MCVCVYAEYVNAFVCVGARARVCLWERQGEAREFVRCVCGKETDTGERELQRQKLGTRTSEKEEEGEGCLHYEVKFTHVHFRS